MVYGYQLLNSSATPAVSILSQRKCRSIDGELHTQLWAGYAAQIQEESEQKGIDEQKIVVVDLGSGEFKRFLCTLVKGKPVKKEEDDSDKDTPKAYEAGLQDLKNVLTNYYKTADTSGVPSSNVYETPLDAIINAVLSGEKIEDFIAKSGGVTGVHFLATSSTRKHFASSDNAASASATHFTFRIIQEKLEARLGGTHVVFRLLQQEDEAKYEFYAAQSAIKYAIDIPLEAQRCPSYGALAWGNGSCQGYTKGFTAQNANDSSSKGDLLNVEIGLKEVTKIINKCVEKIGDKTHVDIYEKVVTDKEGKQTKETRIRFGGDSDSSVGLRLKFMNKVRKEVGVDLQKQIRKKISTPVKFFEAAYDL